MTKPYNTEFYQNMTVAQLRRMNRCADIQFDRDASREDLTKNLCWDAISEMYCDDRQTMTMDELRLFCRYEDIQVPPGTSKKNLIGLLEQTFDDSDSESENEDDSDYDSGSDSDCWQ